MLTHILALIRKDAMLELRRGYALGGLLVFILSVVFIIYISFNEIEPRTWITLYWIAFLFMSVHSVLKGFALESSDRYLYYAQLVPPERIFLSKTLYHTVVLFVMGMLMYAAFSVFAGNPVEDQLRFFLSLAFASVGISLCFTFVSAIAIKSDQSATLMTILSFPVIIPVLLHVIRMSRSALPDSMITDLSTSILTLGAIDLLLIGLGLLLFPYLWRS